jgi:hypothetical protein
LTEELKNIKNIQIVSWFTPQIPQSPSPLNLPKGRLRERPELHLLFKLCSQSRVWFPEAKGVSAPRQHHEKTFSEGVMMGIFPSKIEGIYQETW